MNVRTRKNNKTKLFFSMKSHLFPSFFFKAQNFLVIFFFKDKKKKKERCLNCFVFLWFTYFQTWILRFRVSPLTQVVFTCSQPTVCLHFRPPSGHLFWNFYHFFFHSPFFSFFLSFICCCCCRVEICIRSVISGLQEGGSVSSRKGKEAWQWRVLDVYGEQETHKHSGTDGHRLPSTL